MAVPFRFFLAIAQRALNRAVAFSSNLGFPGDSWNVDVYVYQSDSETDPFGEEASIWSFAYFFYNKKLKRILYFSCRAKSKTCAEEVTESSSKYVYNTDSEEEVNYGMAVGMDA
ncbi:repressor of RNA polymerase III transcription [Haematococcus lacustris]|uniref:Repressor of RNA polymerase III transcription n=1 Tax=Haematococcus lacustris TaxID=44745 RepID=A0A699ZU25_HAELA|nr:repressor of RNA polymerase III transcription [Haematococcus lacustris]